MQITVSGVYRQNNLGGSHEKKKERSYRHKFINISSNLRKKNIITHFSTDFFNDWFTKMWQLQKGSIAICKSANWFSCTERDSLYQVQEKYQEFRKVTTYSMCASCIQDEESKQTCTNPIIELSSIKEK